MERVLWFWLTTCLLPCPGAALVLFSPSITWNPIAPASPILRRCFLEFFITAYHIDRSSLVTLLSKPYLYFKRNYWTISQTCLCLSYSHQQWGYLCPNSVRVGEWWIAGHCSQLGWWWRAWLWLYPPRVWQWSGWQRPPGLSGVHSLLLNKLGQPFLNY